MFAPSSVSWQTLNLTPWALKPIDRVPCLPVLIRNADQRHAVGVHDHNNLNPARSDRINGVADVDRRPFEQFRVAGIDMIYHFLAGVRRIPGHAGAPFRRQGQPGRPSDLDVNPAPLLQADDLRHAGIDHGGARQQLGVDAFVAEAVQGVQTGRKLQILVLLQH